MAGSAKETTQNGNVFSSVKKRSESGSKRLLKGVEISQFCTLVSSAN